MDKFGGQMRLCDFGAHLRECPNGSNCIGPLGTIFTPHRLHAWSLWSTRRFVQASFLSMFPDRAAEITVAIDPGEYGVESYTLRIVSVYLFVLGLWSDLSSSTEMLMLIIKVPAEKESWMR